MSVVTLNADTDTEYSDTAVGTTGMLGVAPPTEALLFVITSPAGPYYPQGFKPVPLYGTTEYIRAAPGGLYYYSALYNIVMALPTGTGAYKLAANYAPGVVAQKNAAKQGYAQNLWLHGPEHWLTEVGTMNLFAVIKDKDGGKHSQQCLDRLLNNRLRSKRAHHPPSRRNDSPGCYPRLCAYPCA